MKGLAFKSPIKVKFLLTFFFAILFLKLNQSAPYVQINMVKNNIVISLRTSNMQGSFLFHGFLEIMERCF